MLVVGFLERMGELLEERREVLLPSLYTFSDPLLRQSFVWTIRELHNAMRSAWRCETVRVERDRAEKYDISPRSRVAVNFKTKLTVRQ